MLRDPTNRLVEELRSNYIQELDPKVSNTTRNVSVLRKNDFGRGGYYGHYWAAFYDPAAVSKTKSCQLLFGLSGKTREFNFGFAFGINCDAYVTKLNSAINANRKAVADYFQSAPADLQVSQGKQSDDDLRTLIASGEGSDVCATQMLELRKSFAIEQIPERSSGLANEIGTLFRWV